MAKSIRISLANKFPLLLGLAVVLTLSACSTNATLPKQSLTFTWRHYNGIGDPSTAVYYCGSRKLGKGDLGLLEFEKIVQRAPTGTTFDIDPYYSPGEQPPRKYPMNGNPIWERLVKEGETRGVQALYPGLIDDVTGYNLGNHASP